MQFEMRGTPDGRLQMGPIARARLTSYIKKHAPLRFTLTADLPESGKMRRYFEGALVGLVAYYQDGMDHHDSDDRRRVREWLKEEFNGEMVTIGGKVHRIAKTTKGRNALTPFVERVVDWIKENYSPPAVALDPENYKHWRDAIFPHGGPETYIDYLVELNILTPHGAT